MGAEVATSIGSQATTSSNSSVLGGTMAGASIGSSTPGISEIGISGFGFRDGSPTFSNSGFASFNEGPIGPISFNNSIDLFAETKAVSPVSPFSEGPANKDSLLDSVTVAKDESQTIFTEPVHLSTHELPKIFENTTTFKSIEPTNEGLVSKDVLKDTAVIAISDDTEVIAEAEKAVFEPRIEVATTDFLGGMNIDSIAESVQSSESMPEVNESVVKSAIEVLKENDPLATIQLESDLRIADEIFDLVDDVADKATAARITNLAIETAVERSGIIETIAKTSSSTEPEAEGEPEPEDETKTQTQAQTETLSMRTRNGDAETIPDTERQLVREKPVDEARIDDMTKAIAQAFEGKAENDQISGTEITAHMSAQPPSEEQSGYAKLLGMSGDGTYTEFVGEISDKEYSHNEQAAAVADARKSAERHYAVTVDRHGTPADPKQAEEVIRGGIAKSGLIFTTIG